MQNAVDTSESIMSGNLRHERLRSWVAEIAALTLPCRIHWHDGPQAE